MFPVTHTPLRFGEQKPPTSLYPQALRNKIRQTVLNELLKPDFLKTVPISTTTHQALKATAQAHGDKLLAFFRAQGKPLAISAEQWATREFQSAVILTLKFGKEPNEEKLLQDIVKQLEDPEKHLKLGSR